MLLFTAKVLIGMLVGTLIGLTGLGGGVLMLPLLIFGLGVPPIIAVGSDAVFNCVTKIGAGWLHWRQGTVNWNIVLALGCGSIPGAIGGVAVLAHLRNVYGDGVNTFVRIAIGILLMVVPTLLLIEGQLKRGHPFPSVIPHGLCPGVMIVGLVAGFLVGMTSVGSGSIIMLLLLILYHFSPLQMVGSDIVHAVLLTAVTSMLHFGLKTIDIWLVAPLLVGSIPGGLLGTRLSLHISVPWLRRILCGILLITGARMLVVNGQ